VYFGKKGVTRISVSGGKKGGKRERTKQGLGGGQRYGSESKPHQKKKLLSTGRWKLIPRKSDEM